MKRYLLVGWLTLAVVFLSNCTLPVRNPYPHDDLTNETWRHDMDVSSTHWVKEADTWFLTGEPNAIEEANRHAADSSAISTMIVRVPDVTNIKVNGAFQVQIFGSDDDHNRVYIYGPNVGVRQTAVDVFGDTLYLHQRENVSRSMSRVIVRVGIADLHHLTQLGRGSIEGRQLYSDTMNITAKGSGNIYLMGDIDLQRITQTGIGSVTVMGARTPALDIYASSPSTKGAVNVSGEVGVQSINHTGEGDVNIIGAKSDFLKINTAGKGKISVYGRANVEEVIARDDTRVYLYRVRGYSLHLHAYDNARIGLAGSTRDLYVDACRAARYEGRYLYAQNAYVRAHDWAHINVSARNKIFASATENSSVYFFGTPLLLSQFIDGNGTIIPISASYVQPLPRVYKRAHRYVRLLCHRSSYYKGDVIDYSTAPYYSSRHGHRGHRIKRRAWRRNKVPHHFNNLHEEQCIHGTT
jgi:hypothetical protein